ncbi:hypothetical protein [Burkholderia pseudomallei]|uniref:hypothetical protein n=1 Tax=Burkholderia pseudomallei TaxID=28450 RepID=UPI00117890C7|nr:hypothetical protein [Burkholderia pseudomallei]
MKLGNVMARSQRQIARQPFDMKEVSAENAIKENGSIRAEFISKLKCLVSASHEHIHSRKARDAFHADLVLAISSAKRIGKFNNVTRFDKIKGALGISRKAEKFKELNALKGRAEMLQNFLREDRFWLPPLLERETLKYNKCMLPGCSGGK